jgi:hypothetical protein
MRIDSRDPRTALAVTATAFILAIGLGRLDVLSFVIPEQVPNDPPGGEMAAPFRLGGRPGGSGLTGPAIEAPPAVDAEQVDIASGTAPGPGADESGLSSTEVAPLQGSRGSDPGPSRSSGDAPRESVVEVRPDPEPTKPTITKPDPPTIESSPDKPLAEPTQQEPEQPTRRVKPVKPEKPAKPVAEPTQPEPERPTRPEKPHEPVKPVAEPTQPEPEPSTAAEPAPKPKVEKPGKPQPDEGEP